MASKLLGGRARYSSSIPVSIPIDGTTFNFPQSMKAFKIQDGSIFFQNSGQSVAGILLNFPNGQIGFGINADEDGVTIPFRPLSVQCFASSEVILEMLF
jgi:hypothetical protein|tara:strand:+ start:199 stop:495 length:297 start_codon:yes stop_codon:yes gene_type:complete